MRSLLPLAILATGCGHKVTVSYMEPADIDIDTDLERVLVINRSLPGGTGEAILGATEGLITGEGFDLDADTSELAIESLLAVLEQTDRYEIVSFRVDGNEVDTSLWDDPLDTRTARKLCRQAHCDAIIALDSLDTDTSSTIVKERERGEKPEFTGATETDLVASFRMYDADGDIVDEARMTVDASAESWSGDRSDALAAASEGPALQDELAVRIGAAYGARIAPHEVIDQRRIYRTGSRDLRDAWKAAKAGDWDLAEKLWKLARTDESDKIAAKAKYNLAVAAELRGDLDAAKRLALRAASELDRARTRDYVSLLDVRADDEVRLAYQLPRS